VSLYYRGRLIPVGSPILRGALMVLRRPSPYQSDHTGILVTGYNAGGYGGLLIAPKAGNRWSDGLWEGPGDSYSLPESLMGGQDDCDLYVPGEWGIRIRQEGAQP